MFYLFDIDYLYLLFVALFALIMDLLLLYYIPILLYKSLFHLLFLLRFFALSYFFLFLHRFLLLMLFLHLVFLPNSRFRLSLNLIFLPPRLLILFHFQILPLRLPLHFQKNGHIFSQKKILIFYPHLNPVVHIYESSSIFLLLIPYLSVHLNLILHIILSLYNCLYHINLLFSFFIISLHKHFICLSIKNVLFIFVFAIYLLFVFANNLFLNILPINSTMSKRCLHLYNISIGNDFNP